MLPMIFRLFNGRIVQRALSAVLFVGTVCSATAGQELDPSRTVTFSKDVAPIVFSNCTTCHHPDGSAPFNLVTYADVRHRASLIAAVTARRLMPPWKSEAGYGEFIGQRHLTTAEIALIEKWVANGAPEGDPRDLPAAPTWTTGWQLGTPDLVVSLEKPYFVPAGGPDFSHIFFIHVPVTKVRYVKGLEFRPGGSAVHHANIRITALRTLGSTINGVAMNSARAPDTPFRHATYPDGYFLGWTPGQVAPLLPKGMGWPLQPGTDLVVEVHFAPTGKAESVRPSIGLFFTDDPPERTPAIIRLGHQSMDIPAGDSAYVETDSFVLPVDVEVAAVQPHAHYLAREILGTATLPDGTEKPLILIRNWDFNWQHVYRYVAPVALPKGTRLAMRIVFDNSTANPRNPHQPPVRVHWGQQTTDEMGDMWIQLLTHTPSELKALNDTIRPKHIAEDIIGYETMVKSDPSNLSLHTDLALMYDQLGRSREAASHFEAIARLQPKSATAYYNLGTALLDSGRPTDAIGQFREALRLQPKLAAAHINLGQALVILGNPDDALPVFQEAVRLDPSLASAHYNLGTVLLGKRQFTAAIDEFRAAVRLQPDWIQALSSLAWTLGTVPTTSFGNNDEAILLAEHAVALTEGRDAGVLDILAAAQASAGQFERAVSTCDAALALRPDPVLTEAILQRQTLYRRRQPYVAP
jgi:tetratricopeptide (TPR) repeat protein